MFDLQSAIYPTRIFYARTEESISDLRVNLARVLLDYWDVPEQTRAHVISVAVELATNAIRHGTGAWGIEYRAVTLRLCRQSIRIECKDSSSKRPVLREKSPTAVGGRGLQIVAALSSDWGVETLDIGKIVWAEVPITR
jgi:two-component sensor histidine kinase